MKKLNICQFSGYGHYKVGLIYRGKMLTTTTSNMSAIDNYNSEPFEKEGRRLRNKIGFDTLKAEILRANNL